MASRLLDSGFADGAVFHTYHAYECVLSAFIAAKGYPVPPDGQARSPHGRGYSSPSGNFLPAGTHKARQIFFMELADQSKPYNARHQALSRFINSDVRNDSLYYNTLHNQLPHEIHNLSFATEFIIEVRLFAREVRKEIR